MRQQHPPRRAPAADRCKSCAAAAQQMPASAPASRGGWWLGFRGQGSLFKGGAGGPSAGMPLWPGVGWRKGDARRSQPLLQVCTLLKGVTVDRDKAALFVWERAAEGGRFCLRSCNLIVGQSISLYFPVIGRIGQQARVARVRASQKEQARYDEEGLRLHTGLMELSLEGIVAFISAPTS